MYVSTTLCIVKAIVHVSQSIILIYHVSFSELYVLYLRVLYIYLWLCMCCFIEQHTSYGGNVVCGEGLFFANRSYTRAFPIDNRWACKSGTNI